MMIIDVMNQYLSGVSQLNDFILRMRSEISFDDLVTLNELNLRFDREIAQIKTNAELLNNDVHLHFLRQGVEARKQLERRGIERRNVIR